MPLPRYSARNFPGPICLLRHARTAGSRTRRCRSGAARRCAGTSTCRAASTHPPRPSGGRPRRTGSTSRWSGCPPTAARRGTRRADGEDQRGRGRGAQHLPERLAGAAAAARSRFTLCRLTRCTIVHRSGTAGMSAGGRVVSWPAGCGSDPPRSRMRPARRGGDRRAAPEPDPGRGQPQQLPAPDPPPDFAFIQTLGSSLPQVSVPELRLRPSAARRPARPLPHARPRDRSVQ